MSDCPWPGEIIDAERKLPLRGLVYEVDVASGPIVRLRLGCLDTPIGDRPKARIWRSDAAPWFDPKDQIPELPRGLDAR